jgi:protease PrsW
VPGRRNGWRRWLPLTLIISFIALCAVAMLVYLGFNFGIAGLSIGLVAAILPVPVLVSCFLWLDRYEPEPTRYLVFCFAWGSCVATLTALAVNSFVAWGFDKIGLPDALVAVLVAPFIEESMKAAGPILLLWRRRREWSGITDGIVYCGLSAIGFAMVENVLYLGGHGYAAGADQYGPATGIQNVFLIFIVRILFTGFAHPLFTSMSGIGLGISSRTSDRRLKWLAPIGGLILAMMLHGTFNLLPTLSAAIGQPLIMLYGYLGFMVPLFFVVVGLAISLRGWEGRLTERILPRYVRAGWFSPPEVAALGSLGRRHSARRWARRVAGDSGLKAMRSFQFASTRLALIRDGMQRGLDRKPQDMVRTVEEEHQLLSAIVGYRAIFQGRDPQAPQAFWDGESYQIAFPDGVTRTVAAPDEPVVPVPVRLPPPPVAVVPGWPPNYAQPGYAQPGYAQPGYAQPYATVPGSSAPPGYAAQPGYATQPGYPAQPGYAAQPGFATQPGYAAQPGFAAQPGQYAQPGHSPQSGYPAQPTSGNSPQQNPGDASQQSGYLGQPTPYGSQPTPGYPAQPPPGYSAQPPPGYSPQPAQGHAGQPAPGYSGQPGPGYAAQPTSGYVNQPAPGYSGEPGPGYAAQPAPGYAGQPAPGYPGQPAPGYPGQPTPGYPGQPMSGYLAQPAPGYPSQLNPGPAAQSSEPTAGSVNLRPPAPEPFSAAPPMSPSPNYMPRPASPPPTGDSSTAQDQSGATQQPAGHPAQQPYGAQPAYPAQQPYGGVQPGYQGQQPYAPAPADQWQQPYAPAYQWQQPESQAPEQPPEPEQPAEPDTDPGRP